MHVFAPALVLCCLSLSAAQAQAQAQPQSPPDQQQAPTPQRATPILGSAPLPENPGAPPDPGDQKMFDQGAAYYDRGDYVHAYQVFYWMAEHEDVAAMRNVALMKRYGRGTPRDPRGARD